MKKLQTLVPVVALALGVSCNKQEVTPKSEDDKTFYAMGSLMGTRLKSIDLKDAEIDMIVQGLEIQRKVRKLLLILLSIEGIFKTFSVKEWKNTENIRPKAQSI